MAAQETCKNCGRIVAWPLPPGTKPYQVHGKVTFSYVVHDGYGCDTGCCGHSVYGGNEQDAELCHAFEFEHPETGQDRLEFARSLASNVFPGVPLDPERCDIVDD